MKNTYLLTIEDNSTEPTQSWWLREKIEELLESEAEHPGYSATVIVERHDEVSE